MVIISQLVPRAHERQRTILLDGESLLVEDLVALSSGRIALDLTPEAWAKVAAGRQVVDNILRENKVAYGINTGFGLFSNVVIAPSKLCELQENLIRSHSSGIGSPLSLSKTRMLLALRINVLSKGHSGIRASVVLQLLDAFNADCLSIVPEKGTVGASGDLAPLSHLALGLMGEGLMWEAETLQAPAADVLASRGLKAIKLAAKEGLALINGTQLITSLGAEAVMRAANTALVADIAVSLSLEVLKGTANAFHPRIHQVRPHVGQMDVARRIRTLLQHDSPSELFLSHNYEGSVQDAYSLRCAPQIHGIVNDTIEFVRGILNVEMNSATDNPMVFTGSVEAVTDFMKSTSGSSANSTAANSSTANSTATASTTASTATAGMPTELKAAQGLIDKLRLELIKNKNKNSPSLKHTSDTFYRGGGGFVISGGNFHGEYPAKALDFLAIAVHELANVSERRIERLVNPSLSGLPAFLVQEGGLNSGFMIAHCTAAALVSENKVLCHPSSVDSLSTSGGKEDHVSMGGFSARKALTIVSHVEMVLAIELLAACQALYLLRPRKTTDALEKVYELIRQQVPPLEKDRFFTPDIEAVVELVRSGAIAQCVEPYLTSSSTSAGGSAAARL